MKVCIPTIGDKGLDERIGEHLGSVPTYTIIDTETNHVEVIPNNSHHMDSFEYHVGLMKENKVDVVVCSNLRHQAITLFEEYRIRVYIGAYGNVRNAIKMWENEMLHQATDETTCGEYEFRKNATE
ncbi:MAG: NifB/NifX family molybdenum-iron cluster-binding protein [Candidatus Altiarchaeota archaeon]|nr:NifB/NifX family molybdenum-iron cluster-binding protein [Candidatus Altiarchaeota archaeon]